ncbi:unnamed protein product [Gongylonema pulchrum]|uniref:Secreted protein n=1 Tax=Gongylonema pulchrum TaxID=637853 RepID=A0A183EDQ5_9BILA|nr:unnamed protein product [Gongylonema pulchrum]
MVTAEKPMLFPLVIAAVCAAASVPGPTSFSSKMLILHSMKAPWPIHKFLHVMDIRELNALFQRRLDKITSDAALAARLSPQYWKNAFFESKEQSAAPHPSFVNH